MSSLQGRGSAARAIGITVDIGHCLIALVNSLPKAFTMAGYTSNSITLAAVTVAAKSEVLNILIAGAGTAGLVIANRLSARSDLTVAVFGPGNDVRWHPDVQDIKL